MIDDKIYTAVSQNLSAEYAKVTFKDLILITESCETGEFGLDDREEANQVDRLFESISKLMGHAHLKHTTQNCDANGAMKPGCGNTVTRLITNEFMFYTKTPLDANAFEMVLKKTAGIASTYPENLQLILSTFVVRTSENKVINGAVIIDCGPEPHIQLIAKNHCAPNDPKYTDQVIGTIPYHVNAHEETPGHDAFEVFGKKIRFSYNNVLFHTTSAKAKYMSIIDICLDHALGVGISNYKAFLNQAKMNLKDRNYVGSALPVQQTQIVTSNSVSINSGNLVGKQYVFADPSGTRSDKRYDLGSDADWRGEGWISELPFGHDLFPYNAPDLMTEYEASGIINLYNLVSRIYAEVTKTYPTIDEHELYQYIYKHWTTNGELIDFLVNLDYSDDTFIYFPTVELLNTQDINGRHLAYEIMVKFVLNAKRYSSEKIQILKARGLDFNAPLNETGITPFIKLIRENSFLPSNLHTLKKVIQDLKPDLNLAAQDEMGKTVLHYVLEKADVDLALALMLDVDALSKFSRVQLDELLFLAKKNGLQAIYFKLNLAAFQCCPKIITKEDCYQNLFAYDGTADAIASTLIQDIESRDYTFGLALGEVVDNPDKIDEMNKVYQEVSRKLAGNQPKQLAVIVKGLSEKNPPFMVKLSENGLFDRLLQPEYNRDNMPLFLSLIEKYLTNQQIQAMLAQAKDRLLMDDFYKIILAAFMTSPKKIDLVECRYKLFIVDADRLVETICNTLEKYDFGFLVGVDAAAHFFNDKEAMSAIYQKLINHPKFNMLFENLLRHRNTASAQIIRKLVEHGALTKLYVSSKNIFDQFKTNAKDDYDSNMLQSILEVEFAIANDDQNTDKILALLDEINIGFEISYLNNKKVTPKLKSELIQASFQLLMNTDVLERLFSIHPEKYKDLKEIAVKYDNAEFLHYLRKIQPSKASTISRAAPVIFSKEQVKKIELSGLINVENSDSQAISEEKSKPIKPKRPF